MKEFADTSPSCNAESSRKVSQDVRTMVAELHAGAGARGPRQVKSPGRCGPRPGDRPGSPTRGVPNTPESTVESQSRTDRWRSQDHRRIPARLSGEPEGEVALDDGFDIPATECGSRFLCHRRQLDEQAGKGGHHQNQSEHPTAVEPRQRAHLRVFCGQRHGQAQQRGAKRGGGTGPVHACENEQAEYHRA